MIWVPKQIPQHRPETDLAVLLYRHMAVSVVGVLIIQTCYLGTLLGPLIFGNSHIQGSTGRFQRNAIIGCQKASSFAKVLREPPMASGPTFVILHINQHSCMFAYTASGIIFMQTPRRCLESRHQQESSWPSTFGQSSLMLVRCPISIFARCMTLGCRASLSLSCW